MKKMIVALLAVVVVLSGTPALAAVYTDLPGDNWAAASVSQAGEYGLMNGQGEGLFGFGKTITKAEFATILCNMFHWNLTKPAAASFEDVAAASWYYGYVETALAHDVMDKSAAFQPNTPITRGEMAAMLVRALGLKEAAKLAQNLPLPFADVTANQGYIGVAYDIGMINGVAADQFAPANFAKREEAAAMLVRVYQKYTAKMSFVHGFYAISAYAQKELAAQMDAVTYSWSAMTVDQNKGVWLNTSSSANGNQYRI
ncbi:MAG: S-layer homology domain-containing protein, partial [Clostridiales bacterium]